jgi:hypothetical protein
MHTIKVIAAGLPLLAVCLLAGRARATTPAAGAVAMGVLWLARRGTP